MNTIVINNNLLGDGLMCMPAVRDWHAQGNPVTMIVSDREFNNIYQHSPAIDELVVATDAQLSSLKSKYRDAIGKVAVFGDKAIFIPDICKALVMSQQNVTWEDDNGRKQRRHPSYVKMIGRQMGLTITDTHYPIRLLDDEIKYGQDFVASFSKPLLVCAALSTSCTSRESSRAVQLPPNKMLSATVWNEFIDYYKDRFDFLFVGAKGEKTIPVNADWMLGEDIRKVAAICKACAAVVSIDTGIMHLAQAVDANLLAICAAVSSQLTDCSATKGKYYCVDHSEFSPLYSPITAVTSAELIDGLKNVVEGLE